MLRSNEACVPQLLSLHSRAREPQLLKPAPRACAPQQEKPLQWEACAPQWRVVPALGNEDPMQPPPKKKKKYNQQKCQEVNLFQY